MSPSTTSFHADRLRITRGWVATVIVSLAVTASFVAAGPAEAAPKAKKTSIAVSSIVAQKGGPIVAGSKITISGTTSSNLVGKKLTVEIRKGTKWLDFAGTATVTKKKSFTITSKAAEVGSVKYRVVFKGSKSLKASKTARSALVWKWFNLVDQTVVEHQEVLGWNRPHETTGVTVAGVSYGRQLAGSSRSNRVSSSDFNLSYKCRSFTTKVGLTDSSASGTTGTFDVYLDGNATTGSQKSVALGAVNTIALDATGVFRIRLQHQANGTKDAFPAWPQAKVLCKGQP